MGLYYNPDDNRIVNITNNSFNINSQLKDMAVVNGYFQEPYLFVLFRVDPNKYDNQGMSSMNNGGITPNIGFDANEDDDNNTTGDLQVF